MGVEIFLGEPPENIKNWILEHSTPPEPAGHADTRFTLEGGTVESKNITGTIDKQWMIDNGYYDEDEGTWLKTITQADIGNTVTSIGYMAFNWCSSLMSVTMPNSVTSIGEGVFMNSSITGIMIPSSVTSIGPHAFDGCSGLTSVTIPPAVTSIDEGVFGGCGFTSVTIPNSVTSIGDSAFYYCIGLESVTIGSGVTSVGNNVFSGSPNIETITVLGKTTAQAQTLLANADVPEGCTIVGELS